MSELTLPGNRRSPHHKPLVWLHAEVRTPPFSTAARIEPGYLLRLLPAGEKLGMPHSRPMPSVAPTCNELRIVDADLTWRIIYRIDEMPSHRRGLPEEDGTDPTRCH